MESNSFKTGWASNRWMDNVIKDIQAKKIVNYKMCAQDRNKWR
jgi:hypothetical protein